MTDVVAVQEMRSLVFQCFNNYKKTTTHLLCIHASTFWRLSAQHQCACRPEAPQPVTPQKASIAAIAAGTVGGTLICALMALFCTVYLRRRCKQMQADASRCTVTRYAVAQRKIPVRTVHFHFCSTNSFWHTMSGLGAECILVLQGHRKREPLLHEMYVSLHISTKSHCEAFCAGMPVAWCRHRRLREGKRKQVVCWWLIMNIHNTYIVISVHYISQSRWSKFVHSNVSQAMQVAKSASCFLQTA